MKAVTRASIFLLLFVSAFASFAADPEERGKDPLALKDWKVDFSKLPQADSRSFLPQPNGVVPSAASHFVTMVPCRIFDTRNPDGPYGGPIFAAGETRTYDIINGPCAGIPSNASAYSFNIAVTEPVARGHVIAWNNGSPKPTVSSLNYMYAGMTISNGIIIPAGTDGKVDVFSLQSAHVIIDINGYFAEGVVTNLNAGDGMTGGGTGNVTLGIADGGVTPAKMNVTGSSNGDILTSNGTAASWQALSLSGFATLAGSNVFTGTNTFNLGIDANGAAITGVATPTNGTDAANKSYVDSAVSGVTGFVQLSPSSVQTTTSTNPVVNLKLDRTGSTLGVSGTSDLLKLSAAGNYAAIPLDKERFRVDNSGGVLAVGGDDGTIPATGAGTRMMFYAKKGAFRVGQVGSTQWDDNNVAPRSFATGKDATASGNQSFAAGDSVTAGGTDSVALGNDATASNNGSFVFGDRAPAATTLATSTDNQFLVRAAGGTIIYSNGSLTAGVTLAAGGGSWSSVSDYHRKENFSELSGEDVLSRLRAIPVSSWNYKSQDPSIRHIGPMAQDFYKAFGVGEDEKLINTIDIEGVSIAAAKALENRTAEQQAEISALKQRNAELEERLRRLESLVTKQQQ